MATLPTIRECMLRQLWLPAQTGAQAGIVSLHFVKLRSGAEVVLTREQLSSFGHPEMPANLNDHAEWTLSGGSTLTPVP